MGDNNMTFEKLSRDLDIALGALADSEENLKRKKHDLDVAKEEWAESQRRFVDARDLLFEHHPVLLEGLTKTIEARQGRPIRDEPQA